MAGLDSWDSGMVHLDGTGPDFNDLDTGFYMQSQDFKVSYTEPT
jgi:hypothetical protein